MRWCARCRNPAIRTALGLRKPLALPDWLEAALATPGSARSARLAPQAARPRVFDFDPDRQSAPGHPDFQGVRLYREALAPDEAERLLSRLDESTWIASQSGKQKQHFGPRFNFARQRMNAERFDGLPDWAHALEARLRARVETDPDRGAALERCRASLADYTTTDVFALRYREAWSSNLDLHVDDLYAYGDVILDISLDTDSVLTFVGPGGPDGPAADPGSRPPLDPALASEPAVCIRVPLPARSIAVLHGPARVAWSHGILARDVQGVRTSLTLRTLAPALRDTEAGRAVLERARRGANTTR